jgi:nicotinate-nucleotide adenylyltransferase
MRVGVLGGTFNPPHLGHLICAQEAWSRLGLDVVVWVPAGVPPHKEIEDDPGPRHRLALCRLATRGDRRLRTSTLELERPGPSYTVDTLRELHARSREDDLTLIVGGDMAQSLPGWRQPEELLRLARVAVAERAGAVRDEIAARLAPLAPGDRVTFFDMPRIDVSSTEIRRRVAAGGPIRYLVPDAVARYIGAEGLYSAAAVARS